MTKILLTFLITVIVAFSADVIVVRSYIFENLRQKIFLHSNFFGNMLNCLQCTGFHTGWITALFITPLSFKFIMAVAFTTSLIGYLYSNIFEKNF